MVELQLNLPRSRENVLAGADRIAQAIDDSKDPYHKHAWGHARWKNAPREGAPESEKLKEALRTGKDMVMHEYAFLLGAEPDDLLAGDASA